jgi:hypothetical protein
MFFSEEKNQKTFIIPHVEKSRTWAESWKFTRNKKSFGSFLLKRTRFLTFLAHQPNPASLSPPSGQC